MKTIAIGAVTAGGKTTLVHALKARLPKAASLHFDDYSFARAGNGIAVIRLCA